MTHLFVTNFISFTYYNIKFHNIFDTEKKKTNLSSQIEDMRLELGRSSISLDIAPSNLPSLSVAAAVSDRIKINTPDDLKQAQIEISAPSVG